MSAPNPFNKTGNAATPKNAPLTAKPSGAPLPGLSRASSGGVIANIDLTGVSANNLIEAGDYPMVLFEAEADVTKAGDSKIVWKFKIVEEGPYYGRELQMHAALTPKALFRTRQIQQALGLTGDNFNITPDIYGTLVIGRIADSEWNDRKISSLNDIYPCPPEYGGIGTKAAIPS